MGGVASLFSHTHLDALPNILGQHLLHFANCTKHHTANMRFDNFVVAFLLTTSTGAKKVHHKTFKKDVSNTRVNVHTSTSKMSDGSYGLVATVTYETSNPNGFGRDDLEPAVALIWKDEDIDPGTLILSKDSWPFANLSGQAGLVLQGQDFPHTYFNGTLEGLFEEGAVSSANALSKVNWAGLFAATGATFMIIPF